MIITQLQGGTGNQMFQYALGYKLAKLRNTTLKLDTSRFARNHSLQDYSDSTLENHLRDKHSYERYLNAIKKRFYSPYNIKYYGTEKIRSYRLSNFSITYKPLNFLDLLKLKVSNNLILVEPEEKDAYIFDKDILNTQDNVYLVGYWQTSKYFDDIYEEIKKEFTVKVSPTVENKKLLEKIQKSNSVCIHVRRGDYLKPVHSSHHGICSKEYYDECVRRIKEQVDNPHFFIFSDEPDWAMENIKTDCPTEVSYNTLDQEYEDIRLMYNCKHFIIANSSFSWWGAWLSSHPNKIVLAPETWVANPTFNTEDVIPSSWIKVAS